MRKRRVIIAAGDHALIETLCAFFGGRGYESVVVRDHSVCPVSRKDERCPGSPNCGDIAVFSHEGPTRNAIELLVAQQRGGCGLATAHKALIAGPLGANERVVLAGLGAPLFPLPVDMRLLERWTVDCEARMDLARPVAIRRKEARAQAGNERMFLLLHGAEAEQIHLLNKSDCGICVRTSHPLMLNQMLKVRSPQTGTTEDAVVRWVRPDHRGSYLVGLTYCA